MYMQIAEIIARRSTCNRGNVGAIIIENKNIVSMGYNGPAAGEAHCGDQCDMTQGCTRSTHAEMNAISKAPPQRGSRDLYITLSPCLSCCKTLAFDHDIDQIFFKEEYRDISGLELVSEECIEVYQIIPNGIIFDWKNNVVVDSHTLYRT